MISHEPHPDRIAIYVRWSTDEQGSGTTLEVQLQACQHYLQSRGWIPQDNLIFIDDGYSGSTLRRPAMDEMRQAVIDGCIDGVVVHKLDRLSRSIVDIVNLVLEEWADKVHLYSVLEPIDTSTDLGRQIFVMLASFADWELSTIRKRMLSGKHRRAQEGRNPGVPRPYGYTKGTEPGQYVVEPSEAPIVKWIFTAYAAGHDASVIARMLNDRGIRTSSGKQWYHQTVNYILDNELYTGYLTFNLTGFESVRVKSEHVVPLIDEALFRRVQSRREQVRNSYSSRAPRRPDSNALLLGRVYCVCGAPMTASGTTYVGSRPYRYYICTDKKKPASNRCCKGSVRMELLENIVIEQTNTILRERYDRMQDKEAIQDTIDQMYNEEIETARQAMMQAATCCKELAKQKERITQDYVNNIISADAYAAAFRKMQTSEDDAHKAYSQALKHYKATTRRLTHRATLEDYEQWLNKLTSWENLDVASRKALLACLVSKVIVDKEPGKNGKLHINIVFNLDSLPS